MKYEPLPLDLELEAAEDDDARNKILRSYWIDLVGCRGFQLIKKVLRDLEADALNSLAVNAKENVVRYNACKFQIVEFIRRSLQPPQTDDEDWNDQVEEEF
jgi:hypothetical protein